MAGKSSSRSIQQHEELQELLAGLVLNGMLGMADGYRQALAALAVIIGVQLLGDLLPRRHLLSQVACLPSKEADLLGGFSIDGKVARLSTKTVLSITGLGYL